MGVAQEGRDFFAHHFFDGAKHATTGGPVGVKDALAATSRLEFLVDANNVRPKWSKERFEGHDMTKIGPEGQRFNRWVSTDVKNPPTQTPSGRRFLCSESLSVSGGSNFNEDTILEMNNFIFIEMPYFNIDLNCRMLIIAPGQKGYSLNA
jgi:hypothetical protein